MQERRDKVKKIQDKIMAPAALKGGTGPPSGPPLRVLLLRQGFPRVTRVVGLQPRAATAAMPLRGGVRAAPRSSAASSRSWRWY